MLSDWLHVNILKAYQMPKHHAAASDNTLIWYTIVTYTLEICCSHYKVIYLECALACTYLIWEFGVSLRDVVLYCRAGFSTFSRLPRVVCARDRSPRESPGSPQDPVSLHWIAAFVGNTSFLFLPSMLNGCKRLQLTFLSHLHVCRL